MELDCINQYEFFWLYRKIRCAAFVHLIFGFKVRGVRKSREISTPLRPPGVKFLVEILVSNSYFLFSTPIAITVVHPHYLGPIPGKILAG